MAKTTWIKICGITCAEDAEIAFQFGAHAIGLNFVPSSKRFITDVEAEAIIQAVRGRGELVGVVANAEPARLQQLRALGLDWLQLHGNESPRELEALLPNAFKAVGVACAADVQTALEYPGARLLLDAKMDGKMGGLGHSFAWELAQEAALKRSVILAGGLNLNNVAQALQTVPVWGVDVASGTEDENPRRKSAYLISEFVSRVRRA